jgi:hypothetical protein
MKRTRLCEAVIVTSGADSKYFDLLKDMYDSLLEHRGERRFALGCLDLGLTNEQREWLRAREIMPVLPTSSLHLSRADREPAKLPLALGLTARPYLRENFPGHDIYIWIDADTWLQNGDALDRLIAGAKRKRAAVVHERERAYNFQAWLFLWTTKHFLLGYGLFRGLWLLSKPHINAGVFALAADAPHWRIWEHCYQRAIDRSGQSAPHDQFSFNEAIHCYRLPVDYLPTTCNWICDRAPPMWDEAKKQFCVPYAPYEPISIMHLAGPAKTANYRLPTRTEARLCGGLRYRAVRVID